MSLVAIRTFFNHIDADVAQSALKAAGIQSAISADDMGGLRPHMSMTNGVRLLVNEDDAAAADEILGTDPEE